MDSQSYSGVQKSQSISEICFRCGLRLSDFILNFFGHSVHSHTQQAPVCLQIQPSDCSAPLLPFPFNIPRRDCQNLTHPPQTPHSHSRSRSFSKPADTHMQPTPQSEKPEAGHAASCQSAILTMRAMLQRLQRVEETISQVIASSFLPFSPLSFHILFSRSVTWFLTCRMFTLHFSLLPPCLSVPDPLQRKAQTENSREFRRKSIKEKAVHLSALFSGNNIAPPQVTMILCVMWPVFSVHLIHQNLQHAYCLVIRHRYYVSGWFAQTMIIFYLSVHKLSGENISLWFNYSSA